MEQTKQTKIQIVATLILKEKLQESEVEKLSHFYMTLEWHLRKQKKKQKKPTCILEKENRVGKMEGKRENTLSNTLEYMNTSSSFQWPLNLRDILF